MFGSKKKKEEQPVRRRPVAVSERSTPVAFSYNANRSADRPRVKAKDRSALGDQEKPSQNNDVSRAKRWAVFAIILIVFVAVMFELHLSSSVNINIVQPMSFQYLPHSLADYSKVTAKAINSSFYNSFKPTLNTTDISDALESAFPELKYVSVTIPLIGSTPNIYLQFQNPELLYATPNGSYVVDSNGVVVAPVQALSSAEVAKLYTVQTMSYNQMTDGVQVLTPQNVTFIQTVGAALKAKNVPINKMVLAPAAEELDVYPTGQPYYVKFNIHQTDALQQVGTYLATVVTLKQQNKTPSQYIDVRVDGRAYYK